MIQKCHDLECLGFSSAPDELDKQEGGTGAGRIDTSIDSQVMDMDSDDDAFLLEAYEVFETI